MYMYGLSCVHVHDIIIIISYPHIAPGLGQAGVLGGGGGGLVGGGGGLGTALSTGGSALGTLGGGGAGGIGGGLGGGGLGQNKGLGLSSGLTLLGTNTQQSSG